MQVIEEALGRIQTCAIAII